MSRESLWEVRHPEFRTVKVAAVDKPGAIMAACREWGIVSEWAAVASGCTAAKLGTATRPKCRRCGKAFGTPGDGPSVCPDCRHKEYLFEREKRNKFRYAASQKRKQKFA